MQLLQRGNQNRTTEPTRANETSSRSHAILQVTTEYGLLSCQLHAYNFMTQFSSSFLMPLFCTQVVVEYQVKDASMNVVNRVGKLSLIDLAGSERALATDQRTVRSLEGANINRSLLALSSCINALVEGKKHIPYRNSKLTQLLKDSLGGACNTVMIANISPCNLSFGETQNTLHWADRAKEIRTKVSPPYISFFNFHSFTEILNALSQQLKFISHVATFYSYIVYYYSKSNSILHVKRRHWLSSFSKFHAWFLSVTKVAPIF